LEDFKVASMTSGSKESGREQRAIEYIGLPIIVVRSPSLAMRGLRGTVVDETRNTLLVEKADGRVVRVPKVGCIFRFEKSGRTFDVDGSLIQYRPEERPKKV